MVCKWTSSTPILLDVQPIGDVAGCDKFSTHLNETTYIKNAKEGISLTLLNANTGFQRFLIKKHLTSYYWNEILWHNRQDRSLLATWPQYYLGS